MPNLMTITELRAEKAKRREDLRIARKHRNEAEARYERQPNRENYAAARAAQEWADNRHAAYLDALWNLQGAMGS